MKLHHLIILSFAVMASTASAQDYGQATMVRIWDNASAPHSNGITQAEQVGEGKRISHTTEAVLYIYRPAAGKATGQTVVVCPGGGYWIVAMSHEGDMASSVSFMTTNEPPQMAAAPARASFHTHDGMGPLMFFSALMGRNYSAATLFSPAVLP